MKLKLGPLPNNETVKLTITLPLHLKQQLDRYAEIHTRAFGAQANAQALVPLIVARFLAKDRAFQRALKESSAKLPVHAPE